jgi:hypothetical protein
MKEFYAGSNPTNRWSWEQDRPQRGTSTSRDEVRDKSRVGAYCIFHQHLFFLDASANRAMLAVISPLIPHCFLAFSERLETRVNFQFHTEPPQSRSAA